MTTLVFATHNPNKAEEINALMPEGYQVRSLADVGFKDTVHEDQETLAGNALKKARTVYQATGQACFADDTGLEVDALNGAPGVYTARYAGESASDKANVDKLLSALEGVENRQGRFRTIIALIWDDGQEYLFEGIAEGVIQEESRGTEGFGYDPVFRPRGYDAAFAEMPQEQKNRISHRQKALTKMINFLA